MISEINNVTVQVASAAARAQSVPKDSAVKTESTLIIAPPQPKVDAKRADVFEAMSKIQNYAHKVERNLNFSVDEGSGKTVIKVVDSATNELVRQIPAEEVLRIARALEQGDASGFLMETKA